MDPTFLTYNSGPLWLLILIVSYSSFQYFTGSAGGEFDDEEDEDEEQLVEGLVNYQDALKEGDKSSLIG